MVWEIPQPFINNKQEINMWKHEFKFPTYKDCKAYVEQVQKFYKDFWNDMWINYPKNDS